MTVKKQGAADKSPRLPALAPRADFCPRAPISYYLIFYQLIWRISFGNLPIPAAATVSDDGYPALGRGVILPYNAAEFLYVIDKHLVIYQRFVEQNVAAREHREAVAALF